MKQFWMLYTKGMKQIWHVPVMIVAIFCITTLYKLYGETNIASQFELIFVLVVYLEKLTIWIAPLLLIFFFRDDWSQKTVCQLHALPVSRSMVFLSRLGVVYTIVFITIAMIAVSEYFSHLNNARYLYMQLSRSYLVAGYAFISIGIFSICTATVYSIHRFRQVVGIIIVVGMYTLTGAMKLDYHSSGGISANLGVLSIMAFMALIYHVIALVIYEKYAEV